MRYKLSLINEDSHLDLTIKKIELRQVFDRLVEGQASVTRVDILSISKRTIVIDVTEQSKGWHAWVGKLLVKYPGMRQYCAPDNEKMMFKWEKTR